MSDLETIFIDGVKESGKCPESENGFDCPICGEYLESGYGYASGFGLGAYSYCEEHGFFDFHPDSEGMEVEAVE